MMDDPMLSLAIALQGTHGGYGVLLGSGVSQAAGIPTGWEIVLDLIDKVAAVRGEPVPDNPVEWYRATFGAEPTYDALLEALAPTPEARTLLLREYFEPTEEEREQGKKVPTKAHQAIARLAAQGAIRVIITTNFDRLMEQALEAEGITPAVVYTPSMAEGVLPMVHERCTLLKVHGDYRDTRLKNTPTELASYDQSINKLLDQVFDEYGLIVCGWSATWDVALRDALMRCPTRRFMTYWATRSNLSSAAQDLLRQRQAKAIFIHNADTFFRDIDEKVQALIDLHRPHPLSARMAAETVKRYLVDARERIRLDDVVQEETERVYAEIGGAGFRINIEPGAVTGELLQTRLKDYKTTCEILLAMYVAGGAWASTDQADVWARSLDRLANPVEGLSGSSWLLRCRRYPALLMLYAAGLAGIARNNYAVLAALLTQAIIRERGTSEPVGLALDTLNVLPTQAAQQLPDMERHWTPLSEHLQATLRESLRTLLPDDTQYEVAFDTLEFLLALVHVDMAKQSSSSTPFAPGCYVWRGAREIWTEVGQEVSRAGNNWGPLRAGLFDRSMERYRKVFETLIKEQQPLIAQMRRY